MNTLFPYTTLFRSNMYPEVSLYIDGAWTKGANGKFLPVLNPATGEEIGKVAHAEKADLDRALAAADKGFKAWQKVSPYDRRSEEHTSELQSLMRISYAVFCLKKKKTTNPLNK